MRKKSHGAEALAGEGEVQVKTGLFSVVGHPRLSMNHILGNLKESAMGLYDETRPAEYLDCDEETLIQNCTNIWQYGNLVED